MVKTKELLPANLQGKTNIEGICETIDKAFTLEGDLDKLLVYDIDNVSSEALPFLAWQFHVDFWRYDLPESVKRDIIKSSIEWHRYKGTPWAVRKLLDILGFADAEIIEFQKAREVYKQSGGKRLDGSWKLDNTVKLVPYYDVIGLPYMHHWAQFVVRNNLANATQEGFDKDIRFAVTAAKNERSWPLYLYWLHIIISAMSEHSCSMLMDKSLTQQYPWDVNRLDGKWAIGTDARYIKIGEFALNGAHSLSEIIQGHSHRNLYNGVITSSNLLSKHIDAYRSIYARVGEPKARLDASWKVGKNHVLTLSDASMAKQTNLEAPANLDTTEAFNFDLAYPASPAQIHRLIKLQRWRLNGRWSLGDSPLPQRLGDFKVRREQSILSDTRRELYKDSILGVLKRLTAFHKLRPDLKLNSSWKIAPARALKLDGAWRLSEAQGAYIDITIKKAA